MLTSLMRTRPWLGFGLGLLISLVVVAIGVSGAVSAAASSPGTALFFTFMAGVGVIVLGSLVSEVLLRRRRPFAQLAPTPHGEPATFLPFAPFSLYVVVATLALALVLALVGVVLAVRADQSGWFAICLLVALGSLALLAPVLRGRVRAGGVWLTPGGIEHRRFGSGWRVAWDDVTGVLPQEPLPVLVREEAVVVRERSSRVGWKGDVRAVDGVLGVETRYLSVDETVLAPLLASYQTRPETRSRLGTPDSLDGRLPR